MSEFSDRPFVAGSVVGLRAFSVDSLGRLTGPSHGGIFKPDENVAQCLKRGSFSSAIWEMDVQLARLSGRPIPPRPGSSSTATSTDHQVGQVTCSCGFYAYFDGSNTYAKPDRVTAIIEGYGVCTVGDRGFRAEKARLLAIVDPGKTRIWNTWQWSVGVGIWCGAFGVTNLFQRDWIWAAILLVLAIANVALSVIEFRRTHKRPKSLRTIRSNYPDVPVYRTKRAALRAHPLTPPPTPTPETDDNFWERTAR